MYKYIQTNVDQENGGYLIVIFLFWPLLALFLACQNFSSKINRRVILAFCVLYGALFFLNTEMDGQRRADSLKDIYAQPAEDFFKIFSTLYEETTDFVESLLLFVVSRFTDSHNILFAIYSLIFGALMLYYLKRMHSHLIFNRNINAYLFFFLLICINPISEINGFRMWTAGWIFMIGVMQYLHSPKLKYIILAASSVLFHFSYIPIVGVFILYTIFKNQTKIYGLLAILSFFIAELNIQKIREYALFIGSASEKKVSSYTDEDYIEKVSELSSQAAWYIQFIEKGMLYFTLLSLLYIYSKTNGKFKYKITDNFYSVTLLFLTFANISSLLPSGFRFYKIFYIVAFSCLLLFYIYEHTSKKIIIINRLGVPIILLFALLSFRIFSDSASFYLLGPSFMMPLAIIENVSLQSILF